MKRLLAKLFGTRIRVKFKLGDTIHTGYLVQYVTVPGPKPKKGHELSDLKLVAIVEHHATVTKQKVHSVFMSDEIQIL